MTMTSSTRRLSTAALALLLAVMSALSTQAATYQTYTDRTAFLNNVFLPVSVDDFDDLTPGNTFVSPETRTVAPYSYDLVASGGLFSRGTNTPADTWMSTAADNTALSFASIASTDGDVNAIGGYFFVTDSSGLLAITGTPITVTVNGDASTALTSSTATETNFFGWVTLGNITSLEITIGSATNRYVAVNDVTFAVPEPSTYALLGFAVSTGGLYRLRRRLMAKARS